MLVSEIKKLIEDKSEPIPFSGCWIWLGALQPGSGYAVWPKAQRNRSVARIAYKAYNGEIPHEQIVRHTCDVTCCVNPAHLLVGTQLDNMQDKVRRGRSSKGELNGKAKLTAEQVIRIRALHTEGKAERLILQEMQVNRYTFYDIINYRSWRHI